MVLMVLLLQDYNDWKKNCVSRGTDVTEKNNEVGFYLSQYPFLLSAEAKKRLLLGESTILQQMAQQQAVVEGMQTGYFLPYFVMQIDREHLLQTCLQQIMTASDADLKKPLKVVFIGEEGVDEGGVRKEFFQLLMGQLLSLEYGMFVPTADARGLWINHINLWSGEEFRLVGALLGLGR